MYAVTGVAGGNNQQDSQLKSACIVTAKTKLETISAGGPPVISKALLSTTAYSFGGRAYGGALTGFVAW